MAAAAAARPVRHPPGVRPRDTLGVDRLQRRRDLPLARGADGASVRAHDRHDRDRRRFSGCRRSRSASTALLLSRVPAHMAVWTGRAPVARRAARSWPRSPPPDRSRCSSCGACVGGVAYSFAFTGGLGLINRAAPTHHRGATLSLLYLFAYLLQALTAIGAGALATALGLGTAVDIMAPVLGLLCVAALVAGRSRRRSGASDRPGHSTALVATERAAGSGVRLARR